jgi:hypothetical protein
VSLSLRLQNETVKPIDLVAAVHVRIETLTAQEKLRALSSQIVSEFPDVFSPIPHIDDLPSDVYC